MLDTPTAAPTTAPAPDLIAAQLDALHGLIVALHGSAQRAAMPQAVVIGLEWLRDDCASILADARAEIARHQAQQDRAARRATFPEDWDIRGERHLGHQPGD